MLARQILPCCCFLIRTAQTDVPFETISRLLKLVRS